MVNLLGPIGSIEPLPTRSSELALPACRLRRIGRLRVPLAGPYRPWATLYRFPDGRLLWQIRLWEYGEPVRRLVSTATLRAYALRSGLAGLADSIDALVLEAVERA